MDEISNNKNNYVNENGTDIKNEKGNGNKIGNGKDSAHKFGMKDFLKTVGRIIAMLVLTASLLCALVSNWLVRNLGTRDLYGTIFSIAQGGDGANMEPFYPIIAESIILIVVAVTVSEILFWVFRDRGRKWFYSVYIMAVISTFIVCLQYLEDEVGALTLIEGKLNNSKLFEDEYVDPDEVKITFPAGKRNLIYISIESMEDTFSSVHYGGAFGRDVIPELTALQLDPDNVNFTAEHEKLNGAYTPANTAWTAASQVAQTSGVPLKDYTSGDRYMPGVVSIGDILDRYGYKQVYIAGSDMNYVDMSEYYSQHGGYEMQDMTYAVDNGLVPPDYYENWGYEDEKLFQFAKDELSKIGDDSQPFNLFIATMDTHFIDGYKCRLCPDDSDIQYENVLTCASTQIADFVEWIKKQDFYEDTTIILSGDHPTMGHNYISEKNVPDKYDRKTYVVIINSGKTYTLDYDRQFTVFDMYPTTLAAIGAKIEGDRLGLGVNLFSDTPTLLEKYGYDKLNDELEKKSEYYNTKLKTVE